MMSMAIRTGIGFDAHRFAERRRLILGGVVVPYELGLEGHSDADVLCHAVCDALLGAVAMGDIGVHFPPGDPRWKDADSVSLLKAVGALVEGTGASVVNVDATVVAEEPALATHVAQMRDNIAQALCLNVDAVSVKATTVEGMGALGRKEGIAAIAVATVEKAS